MKKILLLLVLVLAVQVSYGQEETSHQKYTQSDITDFQTKFTAAEGDLYQLDTDNKVWYIGLSNGSVRLLSNDITGPVKGVYTYTNSDGSTGTIDTNGLTITNVIAGNKIATITQPDGTTTVDIDETITTITDLVLPADGNLIATYTNEKGDDFVITETLTSFTETLVGTYIFTDEKGGTTTVNKADITEGIFTFTNNDGSDVIINTNGLTLTAPITGHLITKVTQPNGVVTNINETITSISDEDDGKITFNDEKGTTSTVVKAKIVAGVAASGKYLYTNGLATDNLTIETAASTNPFKDAAATDAMTSLNVQDAIIELKDALADNTVNVDELSIVGDGNTTPLSVQLSGSTLALVADGIKVADLGITNAQLALKAVTLSKIADGSIDEQIMQWNNTSGKWELVTSEAIPSGTADAQYLYWNNTTKEWFAKDPTGNALKAQTDGTLDVLVDDSTIEINATTNKLVVKDNGITTAKILEGATNTVLRTSSTDVTEWALIETQNIKDRTVAPIDLKDGTAADQILKWDGTNWILATANTGAFGEFMDITGTQTIGIIDAKTPIEFGTTNTITNATYYSATTNTTFKVLVAGTYKVSYRVSLEMSGNTRTGVNFNLYNSTTSTDIPGTFSSLVLRNKHFMYNTATVVKIVEFEKDNEFQVISTRYKGKAAATTAKNGSSITIEKL
ncbi:MAG: hypothetical protein JKY08_01955 [Flavobacteriaceae bacterium]|nr:hypothetical protein [Flavobacteriaceae bacterium]